MRHSRPHFEINAASSAGQATAALSELHYDAVVTDLEMPGGGGLSVLKLLAKQYPETARIVHSSQLETSDTAQLRELSHVVVAKPARDSELLSALDRSLQRAGSSRPAASSR